MLTSGVRRPESRPAPPSTNARTSAQRSLSTANRANRKRERNGAIHPYSAGVVNHELTISTAPRLRAYGMTPMKAMAKSGARNSTMPTALTASPTMRAAVLSRRTSSEVTLSDVTR